LEIVPLGSPLILFIPQALFAALKLPSGERFLAMPSIDDQFWTVHQQGLTSLQPLPTILPRPSVSWRRPSPAIRDPLYNPYRTR
jgi:hypothetical protein